jgi:hypothetical protein
LLISDTRRTVIVAKRKADKDRERFDALIQEAIVDCYNEYEQHMSMAITVEEKVICPFRAKVIGEEVEVTRLQQAESRIGVEAVCRYKDKEYRVELTSLEWGKQKPEGFEWVEAYLYYREQLG